MKFKIVYNAWWMRKGWAMVFWPWMWVGLPREEFSDRHFRHELQHCYQYKRLGRLKFYALYLWGLWNWGYTKHPFEVEAREYQNDPLTPIERNWKERGRIVL